MFIDDIIQVMLGGVEFRGVRTMIKYADDLVLFAESLSTLPLSMNLLNQYYYDKGVNIIIK